MRVFISYRRSTTKAYALLIHDRLSRELGENAAFLDVDSIQLGSNFIDVIRSEVGKCGALVALISHGWLEAASENGVRRLDDPNDFVKLEIRAALQRDIPVIPVLLNGVDMPSANELPEDLSELAFRHGLNIRHDSFNSDIDKLIGYLRQLKPRQTGVDARSPVLSSASEQVRLSGENRQKIVELIAAGPTPKVFADDSFTPELVVLNATALHLFGQEMLTAEIAANVPLGMDNPDYIAIGRSAVTVAQFRQFIEETGHPIALSMWTYEGLFKRKWKERSNRSFLKPGFSQSDNHPVVGVNWHDAKAYTKWLSERTGFVYRMPTNEEWQLAIGQWKSNMTDRYPEWAEVDELDGTVPADMISAGPFSFYRQDGRLWEWSEDVWPADHQEDPADMRDFERGIEKLRSLRSGVLNSLPGNLNQACAVWRGVSYRVSIIGFRVAREFIPQTDNTNRHG